MKRAGNDGKREGERGEKLPSLPLPVVPRALHILSLRPPPRAPPQQSFCGGGSQRVERRAIHEPSLATGDASTQEDINCP